MKPPSMRARMTLGLTLFVAALTLLGGAGLWLQTRAEAQHNARALLETTAARVRQAVQRGASWEEIAAVVREQNLVASSGEVELWRLEPDGREAGHIRSPLAPPKPSRPSPDAPPSSKKPRKPIPPLNDPNGWITQRMLMNEKTLIVGVAWHKTRRALNAQAWALLLVGLLTSGAAGVGAGVLVGRTLSPIERLATQARERAEAGRDAGEVALLAPSPDREVRELVSTFNALLDSVAQGVKQRERFHASTSHELRTPLQALSGTLQLALSRPRPPDELRAALQNALTQSDRLNALTRDLLTLNRLGTGATQPPRELVDVAEACDLALSSLQSPLAEKKLRLSESLQALEVQAPSSHIEMLCRNLLENAVKYASDGGVMRVEISRHGEPRLCIWNETAHPIEGDLSAWFEPFYRPDAARSSRTGGNGLGLAICRAVCEANGWTLCLEPASDSATEGGKAGVEAVVRFA